MLIFFSETLLGLNWAVVADILLVSLNGTCGNTKIETGMLKLEINGVFVHFFFFI